MDPVILVSALSIILLGAVCVFLLLRRRSGSEAEAFRHMVDGLGRQQASLEGRLKALTENQIASHSALQRILEERLEAVSVRMGQSLSDTAQKTAESLGNLQQRLTTIDEAQKNITELSTQVVGLQDVLANKQLRGVFGQIQMEDIVRNGLPPNAYSFQHKLANATRPDCLLILPNPPGSICVDAKFPAESFHAYMAAKETDEKTRHARQIRVDMRKHIADIGGKYIQPGETADCALMFLPSEAIYAELHASFEDVLRISYEARVYIVSPTTLMATLNTMRAILRDAEMRKQAGVIQEHVRRMAEDVQRLAERVDKLRTHFGQAEQDIDDITTSARKIARRADKIERVELGEEHHAREQLVDLALPGDEDTENAEGDGLKLSFSPRRTPAAAP
jgi:DNA recombination protein RmuC